MCMQQSILCYKQCLIFEIAWKRKKGQLLPFLESPLYSIIGHEVQDFVLVEIEVTDKLASSFLEHHFLPIF